MRTPRGDAAGGLGSRASAWRAPTEGRNGEMLTRKENPPGMAISKPVAAPRGISCVQGELVTLALELRGELRLALQESCITVLP